MLRGDPLGPFSEAQRRPACTGWPPDRSVGPRTGGAGDRRGPRHPRRRHSTRCCPPPSSGLSGQSRPAGQDRQAGHQATGGHEPGTHEGQGGVGAGVGERVGGRLVARRVTGPADPAPWWSPRPRSPRARWWSWCPRAPSWWWCRPASSLWCHHLVDRQVGVNREAGVERRDGGVGDGDHRAVVVAGHGEHGYLGDGDVDGGDDLARPGRPRERPHSRGTMSDGSMPAPASGIAPAAEAAMATPAMPIAADAEPTAVHEQRRGGPVGRVGGGAPGGAVVGGLGRVVLHGWCLLLAGDSLSPLPARAPWPPPSDTFRRRCEKYFCRAGRVGPMHVAFRGRLEATRVTGALVASIHRLEATGVARSRVHAREQGSGPVPITERRSRLPTW